MAVPTEDFNFEAAFQKFSKEDLQQTMKQPVATYVKDDFFDSMSCEALERQAEQQKSSADALGLRRCASSTWIPLARRAALAGRAVAVAAKGAAAVAAVAAITAGSSRLAAGWPRRPRRQSR